MPLTIQTLICDVTVRSSQSDTSGAPVSYAAATGAVAGGLAPATEELPPLDLALPSQGAPATDEAEPPISTESPPETFVAGTPAPPVDPKTLTERVWRLFRDDLSIARERG